MKKRLLFYLITSCAVLFSNIGYSQNWQVVGSGYPSHFANANNEIMFIYPFGDTDGGSYSYLQLVQGSRNQGGQSSHFPTQFLVDLFECTDGKTIDQSPLYIPGQPAKNRDPRMKQTVIVPGDTVIVGGFTSMAYTCTNQYLFSYLCKLQNSKKIHSLQFLLQQFLE